MTDFLARDLPPPRNWQDFESLSFDLFSRRWKTNDAELHGRQGQPQAGVDVYGTDRVEQKFTGVQCKGKDAGYGQTLTEKELREEVAKALTFQPPLDVFVVATTAPNDISVQQVARDITEQHRKEGKFEVRVHGWGTLRQHITDYRDLVQKHFYDFAPSDIVGLVATGQADVSVRLERMEGLLRSTKTTLLTGVRDAKDGDPLAARVTELAKLTTDGSPKAALKALQRLLEEEGDSASPLARFRIHANLGSAHMALGDEEEALKCLKQSYEEYPEYPNAKATLALVHLLEGRDEEAEKLAVQVLDEDPENSRAAVVLIDALPSEVDRSSLEERIPVPLRTTVEVLLHLQQRARRLGSEEHALSYAEAALEVAPDDWRAQAAVAEALMMPLASVEGLEITQVLPDGTRSLLDRAIELLRKAWWDLASRDSSYLGRHVAANFISLLSVTGRLDEAQDVLNQAIAQNPDYPPLLKRVAQAALSKGDWSAAEQAVSRIPADERDFSDLLLLAKVRLELGDQAGAAQAADLLKSIAGTDEEHDVALGIGIQTAGLSDGDLSDAIERELASHPQSIVLRSVLFDTVPPGHPARSRIVQQIEALSSGELTIRARLHAAETLYVAGNFDLAGHLYAPLHDDQSDSIALRRHLEALHLADRRAEARALYESLPNKLRTSSRYLQIGIAIYERAGLLQKAVQLLNAALNDRDELRDRLLWMQLLTRLGQSGKFVSWLKSVPETIEGSAAELMMLAAYIDKFLNGDATALAIGYRALRLGYNDPQIHLAFSIGLIINGEARREQLPAPPAVAPDTGVILRNERSGERLFFVIETGPDTRVERGEIITSDDLAKKLIGLGNGDVIEIERVGHAPEPHVIEEVQSRYVFALQRTLRDFAKLFPGNVALGSMDIVGEGEGRFEELFAIVKRRADFAAEIEKLYRSGVAPLPLLAKFAGAPVYDLWESFRDAPEPLLKVTTGIAPEFASGREAAAAGIAVVDPLAIYSWVRLGLVNVIGKCRQQLGVVQATIDALRHLRSEREDLKGRTVGHLGFDGQGYRMVELTDEDKDRVIRVAAEAVELAESLVLLPAESVQPIPKDMQELLGDLHPAYSDTILAALNANRAILSDDLGFRLVAQEAGAKGTWTQSVLQQEVAAGRVTSQEYRDATDALLAAGYDLTQFGHVEVLAELRDAGWKLNARLNRFVEVMARPTIDRDSVVAVLTQVTLAADTSAPSPADAAAIHIAVIDALERQGRHEFARELYSLIAYATEVIKVVEARRRQLPSRLLASTHLSPPALASRPIDGMAAQAAAEIIGRLKAVGVKFD